MNLATCISCGCDDDHACPDGCSWLRVDREAAVGVCSECEGFVEKWDAGDRKGRMEQFTLLRRVGHFSISAETLRRDPRAVQAVMAKCVVVRCELMYESDSFEYHAISPEFDVVAEGEEPPFYSVVIHADKEGEISAVEFQRHVDEPSRILQL